MTKASSVFFDDPEIAKEPLPLREVHAIRLAIHEKEKNLSPEERAERTNKRTSAVMGEFRLRSADAEPARGDKKAV